MAEKYGWRKENKQTEVGQAEEPSYGWRKESSVDIPTTVADNITNRVNTWLKNHDTYISNYQNRNANRKYNYEDSYVSDSADWLKTVSQQKRNFDAEADSILAYMDKFNGYLDADWSKQVRDLLTSARDQQGIVLENSSKDNQWWSNWANEDEYKTSQRYDGYSKKYEGKKYEDIQTALSTLQDGEEKDWLNYFQHDLYEKDNNYNSKATSGLKSYEAQKVIDEKKREEEELPLWLKNLSMGSGYENPVAVGITQAQEAYRSDTSWREPNDKWSDGQKKEFGYLYATDPAKAYQYAEQVNNQINAMAKYEQQQNVGSWASQNFGTGTLGTLGAIASAPLGMADLLDDLIEYGSRGTITQKSNLTPFEMGQAAQSGITNKLNEYGTINDDWFAIGGKGLGDVYSLGVSAANSLVSAYTLGGVGTLVNFIGQGGAAGVDDALSRGATPEQALLYGAIVGAAEGVTEMLPAEKLVKVGSSATLKNFFMKALQQGVGEFAEEGVSYIIGNIADSIIMQDKSNLNAMVKEIMANNPGMTEEEAKKKAWKKMAGDIAFDALGGFATGATNAMTVGGVSTAVDARKGNQKNIDALKQYGDKTDALIQEGLQNDKKSESYQLAEKYQEQVQGKTQKNGKQVEGKAMTGFQIRNLLAANQAEVTKADLEKIQNAAANRLAQVGQREDIYKIAELATKYATGQEMTRAERSTLARSSYGSQVASELLDGIHPDKLLSKWENDMFEESGAEYSTDWTGEIGTESDKFLRYNNKKLTRAILDHLANSVVEDPATYKSIEDRIGAESKYSVSDKGQDTIIESGDAIDLSKAKVVDFVKDKETGKVVDMVLNADGKEVKASEIAYSDDSKSYLFEAVGNIENITPEDATVIVRDYNPDSGLSVGEYLNGVDESFTYGYHGYSVEDMKAGNFAPKLSNTQAMSAYVLGQNASKNVIESQETTHKRMRTVQQALSEQELAAQQKARFESNDVEVYFEDGATVVRFDEHNGQYDEKRMAGVNTAKFLSKLGIGSKYYFYESYVKDGKRVYKDANGKEVKAPNGMYKEADGSIHIDLNAGDAGRGTTLFTLAHELTHFIKQWNSKKFKVLADFLIEEYGKTDMSMHERVLAKQKELTESRGEDITYDEAFEEVVADSMSTMFTDGNLYEKLTKLKVKDQGLFNKIKQFFDKLIAKFRELYAELTPDQKDAQDIREMKDVFDRIQTAFAEALVEASENFQSAEKKVEVKNESIEAVELEVDEKTESVAPKVMNSERTWTSSDYVQEREKAAKEIANAIGVTEQKAKDYIDSVNSIAKMIAEDRSRLDYFSSPGRSSFVDNAEYGGSFDFSTLCKKRRLLTGTFTAIQKALPNTALTADEILDIRNRMKEANLEVSCGLCYVEGSRANMGQFAKEFLRLYKQYYPDAWQPNMADVNTPDGIEWVRINHPECYEQYEYFWNHYGTLKDGDKNLFASQQKPKLYQLHTEYKGEILNKFKNDDKVEDKNLNGGIRLQSFSDFEIVHLIDTMQIIMDMSRVGLAGQAYTKVPDFAWALGDTGLKINLSLIAKGVDANGKLIFDDVEGMPIAEAMKLRDRYSKNVGTILVAFNDEQLLAAMADDRVDFIIPFHRSQWKKSQYEAMGLPAKTKDYTFMQNEKFIKPQYHEYRGRMVKDKATNYMPNEYWDFSKSGKENAEAYLEMCARNNKRPKFYKLLTNNGDGSYSLKADGSTDGYWKLLIDFKMYDNEGNGSPQMGVKPEFNMEEANRMLETYNGGHSNFPVAQGIVDSFVKDYKASHKGVKFSDRDSKGKQLGEDQLEYFENSKVRDRNGNLQVVYHGGTVEYEFDTTRGGKGATQYGPGSYFTDSEYYAKEYTWYRGGDVRDYYLNIEKLFDDTDMEATSQMPEWKKLEQILRSNGIEEKYIKRFADGGFAYMSRYLAIKAGAQTSSSWEGSEQLNAMIREAGFDGIKGDLNDSYQYVIFTPNQAKLTTNEVPSTFYDTRYSERTGRSVSNRHLLANAFEGITNGSDEYKLIQKYKGYIAELNSLDEKLSKFNQKIRKIRFGKGEYDAEKLNRLEGEAKKIAEAISKYDQYLVSLEASAPLRRVIERERKKEAQKTRDHVKEIQQNKKVRAEQTELRHKIRKAIRDLDKVLNRGNKKLNVKEDIQGVVTKALQAAEILFTDNYGNYDMLRSGIKADLSDAEEELVNTCTRMLKDLDKMPTDGYDNWQARQEAENRLKTKMIKLNEVFARERKRLNNTTVSSILGELADAYATLEKSEQSYVQGAYNEAVYNFLKSLQSEVGGTIVKDMTKGQLESVYAAYKMVLTTVRKANELFNQCIKMSREQLGNAVIKEVIKAGGVHGLWTKAEITKSQADWNNTKPIWVANRIGSESFAKLMQGLFDGQYNFARDIEEAKQFKLSMDEKFHPRNWDKDKLYEFESSTGKKFSLNLQQIMSLYAFSKREQAYSHLLNGGFVFDGNSTVIVDEKGIKRTYIHNGATSYKLNEATLNGIINSLTAEQKAYVDEMQAYLSDVMGAKGNEVSMQLYGIKMFNEKFYFPLRSSGAYMERAKEAELKKQQGQINLVNSGFTHAVKPQAKNPIILSGFMDVWAEHCNEMSMYHSMVLPMEDFRKVYNYSTVHDENMESASVFQTIQDAYGSAATNYIDQLYRELNAGATVDPRETPWKTFISKFKKSAVMLSASVVVQQFSSIGRAYALIDPKYFIGTKVNSGTQMAVAEEMRKYAPVAIIKEMGGFDTGTKGSAKSYIVAEQYGKGERFKGLLKDEQYRGDIMGYLPAKADEKTWCAIWEAVKRETKAKHPKMDVKSEKFLKLAGERFSEVIEKTQVYDSVLARSANMRSKGAFMQMATAFMAEPTTTINLLEDALRGRSVKKIARTFGAVAVSIVLNNALASVVYAMRDDDEDETYIEKYFQSLTSGLIDDINPMNYYPFLKDVYSLFQGYDVERTDMSVFADLRDAMKKAVGLIGKDTSNMDENELAEHWRNVNSVLLSVLDAGCSVFGVPVKNVRRDVNGMINAYTTVRKDLSKERDNSWNSFWDKVGSAAKDTIPVYAWTKDEAKQDKLYEAITEGDKSYLTRLKSTYKKESSYESAVRKALRENDPRIHEAAQARIDGKVDAYKRIFREIQNERKFSFDEIMSAINSEESAIRNKTESDKVTSDYSASDFVDAVILGDTSTAEAMKAEIISTKVANGKTREEAEEQFASAVYSNTRTAFDDGFLDQAGAKKMLTKYAGKDTEEATAKVNYWAFCKANPGYDFSESNYERYQEIAVPAGISLSVFAQYLNGTKGLATKYDEWGDVEVSKREQVLEVIDSLPLTWEQKDALYLAAGYSEDKIWDVPW